MAVENLDDIREKYMRPALLFEPDPKRISESGLRPHSAFGSVTHGVAGETWPVHNDQALAPLLQINLEDCPYRPAGCEKIRFLTLFVHPTEYPDDDENGTTWCLRTYQKTSNLVPLERPNLEWKIKEVPLSSPVLAEDYPCSDDVEEQISDQLWEDFKSSYPTLGGIKWGGWPLLIQSEIFWAPWQQHPADPKFVLQVDSLESAGWHWGHGGCAYFGRGTAPKHKDTWAMEWQCF